MGLPGTRSGRDVDGLYGELAAVIGSPATDVLMLEFAGQSIFVPHHPPAEHPLVKAVGIECAGQVAEFWHGTTIAFPLGDARRQSVLRLAANGESINAIVRSATVSRSFVYKVLSESRLIGGSSAS